MGIVATVFINILACEFGYLNGEARSVARDKVWHTSLIAHDTLPPPAMALAQDSIFPDRGILANDTAQIENLYQSKLDANIGNQRSFKDFGSRLLPPRVAGGTSGKLNYVLFDGNYENLDHHSDLDLFYYYYCKSRFSQEGNLAKLTLAR